MRSDLSPARWERISALLDEVIDLPEGQRGPLLDLACGGDLTLRADVETLLRANAQAGSFLEGAAGVRAESLLQEMVERAEHEEDPLIGQALGSWSPVRRLGEGGMGVVYLAERIGRDLSQTAALKVIKRGMDTQQVLSRFGAERRALALMDHPSIAKILDVGVTPDSRPFFAMEYVQGVPITEYCDERHSTLKERLELFLEICEAVQHAHQKAVIHRDLKPSNVLARMKDGRPAVTVIDFGVAKALAQPLGERTLVTELGMVIGTPEYMSPEQATTSGPDVDTRSDVYSLGVMLYELLIGVLPFEAGTLRQVSLDEVCRMIREEEPPRPSARLVTLGDRTNEKARCRQLEPTALRRALRGDLDWITMRALEKDPTRRYGSPAELAEEIRRHMRHEPVLAHAPSAAYRAGKFVRRHRLAVAAAAVMAIGLGAGAIGSTIGLVRARRAEARALHEARAKGQVADFLKNLFTVSNPSEARGNSITARELLDKAAASVATQLKDQPVIRAEMAGVMGQVYSNLGLYAPAEALTTQAFETRKRELGPEHADTLESMFQLAGLATQQGHYADAERRAKEVLELRKRVLGRDNTATAAAMSVVGIALWRQRRFAEAEQILLDALDIDKRLLGPEHPDTLGAMHNLANVYDGQGRDSDGEPLRQQALEGLRRVLGPEHPKTLSAMGALANSFERQGRLAEAEQVHRETIAIEKRVLGPEHQGTLVSMMNLANVYITARRYPEAEGLLREVVETETRVLGPRHSATFLSMYNLGCVLALRGERAKAMQSLRDAVDNGYFNSGGMSKDADLASLRGPELTALVARARQNGEALTASSVAKGGTP